MKTFFPKFKTLAWDRCFRWWWRTLGYHSRGPCVSHPECLCGRVCSLLSLACYRVFPFVSLRVSFIIFFFFSLLLEQYFSRPVHICASLTRARVFGSCVFLLGASCGQRSRAIKTTTKGSERGNRSQSRELNDHEPDASIGIDSFFCGGHLSTGYKLM